MLHLKVGSLRTSIIFTLMLLGFISLMITLLGFERAFRLWNVPTRTPYFADLRTITAGADSQRLGYEPMIDNPEDPWNRPMNYPRIWKAAYPLGLTQEHTLLMGAGVIFTFLLGLVLLFRHTTPKLLVFAFPAVLSPAVLLGVERGNIDLFVFFLAVLSAVSAGSGRWWHSLASSLLALFAKLFPIFWLPLYFHAGAPRRVLPLFIGVGLLYFTITWADLRLIAAATPQTPFTAYGLKGLFLASISYAPHFASYVQVASYCVALIILAYCINLYICRHKRSDLSELPAGNVRERYYLFLIGGSTFVGTFLLGNNWNYRLIFLLLCLPFALSLLESSRHTSERTLALVFLAGMYGSLWGIAMESLSSYFPKGSIFLLDEALNWLTFASLALMVAVVSAESCQSRRNS